jgi:hypothetical protein
MATYGIMDRPEFWMPDPPMTTIETLKGAGSEIIPAPLGSSEREAYDRKRSEIESARNFAMTEFAVAYGVVEWSRDKEKWSKAPPKGWELDPEIREVLSRVSEKKRTQFIMYELIVTPRDQMRVERVCRPVDMGPVLAEEVQAAEDMFQGDVEGDSAEGDGE